jgi:predicted nucleotidyltransferase
MPILGIIMPVMGMKTKPPLNAQAQAQSQPQPKPSKPTRALAPTPKANEVRATYDLKPTVTASGLADALFTTTQQRVLGLLFGLPDRSFFANEIITLTGSGSGAVQRELARLEASALVTTRWIGNQKHYQANKDSPIFYPLWSIVQNTVGVAGPLQSALHPLASQIVAAFVYGSVAKQSDTAASDIDLMIISDSLTYADVFAALEVIAPKLQRQVNPTVLTRNELAKRVTAKESFITRVLAQPKIWLQGEGNDLGI